MNITDLIFDYMEDNRRRIHYITDQYSPEAMVWRPDPEANSIAVTIWHFSRLADVFQTQHFKNEPSDNEVWFTAGWAEKTGYDPRGIGVRGWGAIIGYTQEEVAAIPLMANQDIKDYYDQVLDQMKAVISALSPDVLDTPAPGYEQKYTYLHWIKLSLLDTTRHLGEIFAIKAMWDRKFSQDK